MQATSTTATAMPTIQPSTADSGNGAMRARLPPRRVRAQARRPGPEPDRHGRGGETRPAAPDLAAGRVITT